MTSCGSGLTGTRPCRGDRSIMVATRSLDESEYMMPTDDPLTTDPRHYRLLWENEHVRVLDYTDAPGDETHLHHHPNSVMVTLTDFERRLTVDDRSRDVALPAGTAVWLAAQRHSGRNTGTTPTHTILIELKDAPGEADQPGTLGPTDRRAGGL
jgi:quercetin dioxygenase-like cupin family protein